MNKPTGCVLFDLDGTLADTAPDLVAPILAMRAERGLPPMAFTELRPFASMGARGLLGKGFGLTKESPDFAPMRDEFLARYEAGICIKTTLFPGIAETLQAIEAQGLSWGVVSNKIERYVRLLCTALKLDERATCLVGGDSTPTPKPNPAPLLLGARLSGRNPADCIYVGDDLRDVQAGSAAGMRTVAAAYGYNGPEDPPSSWQADFIVSHAGELPEVVSRCFARER